MRMVAIGQLLDLLISKTYLFFLYLVSRDNGHCPVLYIYHLLFSCWLTLAGECRKIPVVRIEGSNPQPVPAPSYSRYVAVPRDASWFWINQNVHQNCQVLDALCHWSNRIEESCYRHNALLRYDGNRGLQRIKSCSTRRNDQRPFGFRAERDRGISSCDTDCGSG
jgi:hypothetical protein